MGSQVLPLMIEEPSRWEEGRRSMARGLETGLDRLVNAVTRRA